jgi:hypothetical protein
VESRESWKAVGAKSVQVWQRRQVSTRRWRPAPLTPNFQRFYFQSGKVKSVSWRRLEAGARARWYFLTGPRAALAPPLTRVWRGALRRRPSERGEEGGLATPLAALLECCRWRVRGRRTGARPRGCTIRTASQGRGDAPCSSIARRLAPDRWALAGGGEGEGEGGRGDANSPSP